MSKAERPMKKPNLEISKVVTRADWLSARLELGLALAFVHGLLGETQVFARARIEPERLGRLIRGVWHCSAVAWAGVAVLLIVAPWMGSQMARYSALAIVVGLAVAGL